MDDDKKWQIDESTRKKMSDAHRQSWDSGARVHPITKLKGENLSLQERLSAVEAWRERVQDVARRYRDLLAKGADSKNAELSAMCRELIDALGS